MVKIGILVSLKVSQNVPAADRPIWELIRVHDLSPYDFNHFFDNLGQLVFLDGAYPVQDDMIVCGK